MLNPILFYFLESVSFHKDFSHESLNVSSTENVTDGPTGLSTGGKWSEFNNQNFKTSWMNFILQLHSLSPTTEPLVRHSSGKKLSAGITIWSEYWRVHTFLLSKPSNHPKYAIWIFCGIIKYFTSGLVYIYLVQKMHYFNISFYYFGISYQLYWLQTQ